MAFGRPHPELISLVLIQVQDGEDVSERIPGILDCASCKIKEWQAQQGEFLGWSLNPVDVIIVHVDERTQEQVVVSDLGLACYIDDGEVKRFSSGSMYMRNCY